MYVCININITTNTIWWFFFLSCELENGEDPRASDQMKKSNETNEPKDSQKIPENM